MSSGNNTTSSEDWKCLTDATWAWTLAVVIFLTLLNFVCTCCFLRWYSKATLSYAWYNYTKEPGFSSPENPLCFAYESFFPVNLALLCCFDLKLRGQRFRRCFLRTFKAAATFGSLVYLVVYFKPLQSFSYGVMVSYTIPIPFSFLADCLVHDARLRASMDGGKYKMARGRLNQLLRDCVFHAIRGAFVLSTGETLQVLQHSFDKHDNGCLDLTPAVGFRDGSDGYLKFVFPTIVPCATMFYLQMRKAHRKDKKFRSQQM